MTSNSITIPTVSNDFAEVVIYAPSPAAKEAARRIADAIARTSDVKGTNISIRNGSAPPAPGTYSK